jgi:hypothetical protein
VPAVSPAPAPLQSGYIVARYGDIRIHSFCVGRAYPTLFLTVNGNDSIMSTERPNNVIALAPYRFAHQASQRRSRPYVTWYPNVGFVAPTPNTLAPIRQLRTARGPESM